MPKTLQQQRTGEGKIKKEGDGTLSKPERNLAKKWTPEETKDFVLRLSNFRYKRRDIIEDLGENILPKLYSGNKRQQKETRLVFDKQLGKAIILCGLDSHHVLGRTFKEDLRPLVLEFCNQLVKEYDCKTYSEKALAEIAAGAYVKHLRYSARIEGFIDDPWLSHEKNGCMAILGKQIDRSIRTYIGAIQILRQLKNPPVDFNVIAKTAFISQNQQINAFNKVSGKQDEIITAE